MGGCGRSRGTLRDAAVRHAEELAAVIPIPLVPRAHDHVEELGGAAVAAVVIDGLPLATVVPKEVAVLRELVQVAARDDVQEDAPAGEPVEAGRHACRDGRRDEAGPERHEELDALCVLGERRCDHPRVEAHLAGRHEHRLEAGGFGAASDFDEVFERGLHPVLASPRRASSPIDGTNHMRCTAGEITGAAPGSGTRGQ